MKKPALLALLLVLVVGTCAAGYYIYSSRKPFQDTKDANKFSAFSSTSNDVEGLLEGFDPNISLRETFVTYNPKMGLKVEKDSQGLVRLYEITGVSSGEIKEEEMFFPELTSPYLTYEILPVYFLDRRGTVRNLNLIIAIYSRSKEDGNKYETNLSEWLLRSLAGNTSFAPGKDGIESLIPRSSKISFVPYLNYGIELTEDYTRALNLYYKKDGGLEKIQEDLRNYINSDLSTDFKGSVPLLTTSPEIEADEK